MDDGQKEETNLKSHYDDPESNVSEYWAKKKKREESNIIICLVIFLGAIILSAYIRNIIPIVVGVVLSIIIYQRDN